MIVLRNRRLVLLMMTMTAAAFFGCREREAEVAYNRNLGDDAVSLMPVAGIHIDPRVKDGTTNWRDFVRPDGQPTEGGEASSVEDEVRAVLDEYNELVAEFDADGDPEDLALYFVERQRSVVRKLTELQPTFLAKMTQLADALKEKAPDSADAVDAIMVAMSADADMAIRVDDLTEVSETEATGTLAVSDTLAIPGPAIEVKFVFVDDEWLIELPMLDALGPTLETQMAQIDTAIAGIKSGLVPAELVIEQFEAMVKPAPNDDSNDGDDAEDDPGEDSEEDAEDDSD
ncbi:MAG: hypothetical protein IID36_03890 [Planctomycetes bacterium]|nr:hypothetical protein [Planctomycetota bacterium]